MRRFEVGKTYSGPDIFCGGIVRYHCIERTETEVTFREVSDVFLNESMFDESMEAPISVMQIECDEEYCTEFVAISEYHGARILMYAMQN